MVSEGGDQPASRLARRLGTGDAVVLGLGSMLGAGVFAIVGPAAAAAGPGLLVGLGLAGALAYCNATSSAQLAALHPVSGGTYIYASRQLGDLWGYLAGWAFVVGKVASCATIALTFAAYAAPGFARPAAVVAVLALAAVNAAGVRKTARVTWVLVTLVVAALGVLAAVTLSGSAADVSRVGGFGAGGVSGVLEAGALWFFAFAGYARIATLGEEVRDPARTIPRAIPLALGAVLVLYAGVAVAALAGAGAERLAEAEAPLAAAADAARGGADGVLAVDVVVRVGAAVATLGVLLSLLAGVARTSFAMAADGHLPGALARVHPRSAVPRWAESVVALAVAALVLVVGLRTALSFSAFTVLCYYALTNASALTLSPAQLRWPRWLAAAGLVGCLTLALSLPPTEVAAGTALLAVGAAVYGLRGRVGQ
jgi:APA family basic amino acid/polyamine antiporter